MASGTADLQRDLGGAIMQSILGALLTAGYASAVAAAIAAAPNKEKITAWAKEYWDALHPHSAPGAYVNFMMDTEGEDRVKASYGKNYEKLVKIKKKYDPANFFRVNQNIRPGK